MRRLLAQRSAAHYHCMSRVCGGELLLGEREKEVLVGMLWQVAEFCGVQILAYCVMGNHFHVLVFVPDKVEVADSELVARYSVLYSKSRAPYQPTPEVLASIFEAGGEEAAAWRERLTARMHDVSAFMKTVKQRFSVWYNKSHQRYGTLWADRFKSVLVEGSPDALMTVGAYIDLNPIRAGLVKDPSDYRWSSYAEALAGHWRAREGLCAQQGEEFEAFGIVLKNHRMLLYGKGQMGAEGEARLDPERARKVLSEGGKVSLPELLRCRVRYFSDGAVLGSKGFVQAWFEANREWLNPKRRAGPYPLAGSDWRGLTVYRALRKEVFGTDMGSVAQRKPII